MSTRTLRLVAAFVAVSLVTRWLSLMVDVVDLDETCHILGARVLSSGGLLYTHFVDNKPPLLYAYYALPQILGGHGLFSVHLLTVLVTVPLTALAASAFYGHARVGVTAAVTFLLFSSAYVAHDMLAANAEIVMVLPASWALVLLCRERAGLDVRRAFAAGLLFGVAVLVKPQVATWAAACAGVAVYTHGREGRWRHALVESGVLTLGVIVVPVAVYVWFAVRGGAEALLYWTVWHNLWYAENPIPADEALRRFAAFFLTFVLVTAPLWWGAVHHSALVQPEYRRRLVRWLLVASIVPVFLGFRFYPHYFIQLYVPLALGAAPWLDLELAWPLSRTGRLLAGWSALMVAGFMAANTVLYFGNVRVIRERNPVYHAVADRLRTDPCAPGPVFVWGWAPIINYYAGMPVASRFVVMPQSRLTGYEPGNLESNWGEVPEGTVVPEHWDWLMDDLARSRPTFIVDTAPANLYRWGRYPMARYPRLQAFVDERYTLADDVRGVRIYERRDCRAVPPGAARREAKSP